MLALLPGKVGLFVLALLPGQVGLYCAGSTSRKGRSFLCWLYFQDR